MCIRDSSRTIVYKGMLVATQMRRFFTDLNDAAVETSLALVHSRYSTNTTPSWERAHPNRYIKMCIRDRLPGQRVRRAVQDQAGHRR